MTAFLWAFARQANLSDRDVDTMTTQMVVDVVSARFGRRHDLPAARPATMADIDRLL